MALAGSPVGSCLAYTLLCLGILSCNSALLESRTRGGWMSMVQYDVCRLFSSDCAFESPQGILLTELIYSSH